MEDETESFMIPQDLMSARAVTMHEIARTIHTVLDPDAKLMMLKAMDCLLFSINPPRGQLHQVN